MKLHFREDIVSFWEAKVETMTSDTKALNCLKRNGMNTVKDLYEKMCIEGELEKCRGLGVRNIKAIKSALVEFYCHFLNEEEVTGFFKKGISASEALDVVIKEMEKKNEKDDKC